MHFINSSLFINDRVIGYSGYIERFSSRNDHYNEYSKQFSYNFAKANHDANLHMMYQNRQCNWIRQRKHNLPY